MAITGILFELQTRGEGTFWSSTLEGAYATAARRAHPVRILPLYLSRVAKITVGSPVWRMPVSYRLDQVTGERDL